MNRREGNSSVVAERKTPGATLEVTAPSTNSRQSTRNSPPAATNKVIPSERSVTLSKDEWVIDESTRKLYLSLLADKEVKNRGGQVKPAPRIIPLPKEKTAAAAPVPEVKQSASVTIGLDEGAESTTRFVLYAAILIGCAFLLYKAIIWSASSRSTPAGRRTVSARHQLSPSSKSTSTPQTVEAPSSDSAVTMASVTEPSVTLVPTMILDQGTPNQSSTHTLTIHNRTPFEMAFAVEARDLVSQDGKPVYLTAGEAEGSVAATVVYSTRTLEVKPMQSASLEITLTMPEHTTVRGVAILLNARSGLPQGEAGLVTASLGSIITWAGDPISSGGQLATASSGPASGTNLAISQWIVDPPRSCASSDSPAPAGAGLEDSAGGAQ